MEKGWIYVSFAVFLALFLLLNFVGFFEEGKLTGRVIEDNETTNETTTETTNETTNETTTETTNETTNESVNETGVTNQTQEESSPITSAIIEEEQVVEEQPEETTQTEEVVEQQEIPDLTPEITTEPPEQQSEEPSQITGSAVEEENQTECNECLLGKWCYSIDDRSRGKYCLENTTWTPQKAFNGTCTENFECRSNSCIEGICTQTNIINLIVEWFKELFKIGGSAYRINDTNQSSINQTSG